MRSPNSVVFISFLLLRGNASPTAELNIFHTLSVLWRQRLQIYCPRGDGWCCSAAAGHLQTPPLCCFIVLHSRFALALEGFETPQSACCICAHTFRWKPRLCPAPLSGCILLNQLVWDKSAPEFNPPAHLPLFPPEELRCTKLALCFITQNTCF